MSETTERRADADRWLHRAAQAPFAIGDQVVAQRTLSGPLGQAPVPAGTRGVVLGVREDKRPWPIRVRFDGASLPWHVKPEEIQLGGDW